MSQFQAWALNKQRTALRDSLNTWLARVKGNQTLCDSLHTRYFGN